MLKIHWLFYNWHEDIKFCKKPASGGIPARENNTTNAIDRTGWFVDNPDRSSIFIKKYFFLSINKHEKMLMSLLNKLKCKLQNFVFLDLFSCLQEHNPYDQLNYNNKSF